MTTIMIEKSPEGLHKGFTCMGHAGFAKKGQPDILCSAISTVAIHTINGMELAGQELDVSENEETGFMRCVIKGSQATGVKQLMDAFENTVMKLSEEYGDKFLQIQFKEVKDNA